eukprot:COSAG05_NODE_3234_length_2218_cov_1.479000_1_plen_238_part_00
MEILATIGATVLQAGDPDADAPGSGLATTGQREGPPPRVSAAMASAQQKAYEQMHATVQQQIKAARARARKIAKEKLQEQKKNEEAEVRARDLQAFELLQSGRERALYAQPRRLQSDFGRQQGGSADVNQLRFWQHAARPEIQQAAQQASDPGRGIYVNPAADARGQYHNVHVPQHRSICEDCNLKRPTYGILAENTKRWCAACGKQRKGAVNLDQAKRKRAEQTDPSGTVVQQEQY